MAKSKRDQEPTPAAGGGPGAGEIGETARVGALAAKYQIGRHFIYAAMERGDIAYLRLGRHKRVLIASFNEYLKRNLVPASGAAGSVPS